MEAIQAFIAHPYTSAAIAGAAAALVVDVAAFKNWKTWHDAATYNWGTASFRWFQGAGIGFLSALGIQVLS